MNIRKALIESVHAKCSGSLHVRVDRFIKSPVQDEKISSFSVATLENGAIGISYNLFHRDPVELERYLTWDPHVVVGREAREVMGYSLSDDALESTAGMAVLNALSQGFMRENPGAYRMDFETDVMDLIGLDSTTTVGLVGYFSPMIKNLMSRAGEVIVLEKSQEILAGSYPFTMTADPAMLQRCDKVLMTATTVLNDTLPGLLPHCADASFVGVMGPTAGFLPDALFDLGVHAVGSTFIDDPGLFLERFSTGIKWGDATRKVWIIREG
ncbi:MAG: DUF364 domain-containing protein [Syntrophaceae bacterium]